MEGGVTLSSVRDLLPLSGISLVEEGNREQAKVNKSIECFSGRPWRTCLTLKFSPLRPIR